MNKFNEQNKATNSAQANQGAQENKNAQDIKSAQDNKNMNAEPATNADNNKMAQAVAADKAKIADGTNKSTLVPKKDPFNGKWKAQIQAAKSNWSKITESELLKSEGSEVSLTELVQQRYSLSRDAANQQVKTFITKCQS
jgi:uncharacterized protein YjbJ (UPF0337 family)